MVPLHTVPGTEETPAGLQELLSSSASFLTHCLVLSQMKTAGAMSHSLFKSAGFVGMLFDRMNGNDLFRALGGSTAYDEIRECCSTVVKIEHVQGWCGQSPSYMRGDWTSFLCLIPADVSRKAIV